MNEHPDLVMIEDVQAGETPTHQRANYA